MLARAASNSFRGCRKTIEAALVDTFFLLCRLHERSPEFFYSLNAQAHPPGWRREAVTAGSGAAIC